MRNIILSILLLSVNAVTMALGKTIDNSYNMTCLNMATGLPSNSITAIHEDSFGFMWIASDIGGLVRYDGFSFLNLGVASRGTSLRSNSCRSICEDRFKRLWVTFEEGTDVLDLQTMQPARLPAPHGGISLDSLLAQRPLRAVTDSQGCVWLVTETAVCRIAFDEQGQVESIMQHPYAARPLDVAVADIDGDGRLWAAIDGIICRLVVRNGQLVRDIISPALNEAIAGNYVTCMLQQGNTTWVGTNEGLVGFDASTQTARRYRHDDQPASLAHNFVTCLSTFNGQLLVGTLSGIDMFSMPEAAAASPSQHFSHWNSHSSVNPLGSDFIHCLLPTHGMLWVGTDNAGIAKLTPRHLLLQNFVHTAQPESLSPGCVNAMYAQPDGTLWIGTVEGGLNRRAPGSAAFTHFTTANSRLTHNSVSALTPGNDNTLWIATWGGGICRISMLPPHRIEPLSELLPAGNNIPPFLLQFVGALAFDARNNALWIAGNSGIYYYDLRTNTIEEPYPGCRDERGCIGSIIDRDGQLWIGCLDGVRIIDLKSRRGSTFNVRRLRHKLDNPKSGITDKITAFCQTADGTLWLGSNGYGLYRRTTNERGEETFHCYTTDDGLANNAVRGIVEDRDGHLWITTTHGLSELNPQTGIFNNYDEDDGLHTSQFYWNSAITSPDGHVYLGGETALTELQGFNTASIYEGHLRFTRLYVDNQEICLPGKYLDADISQAQRLRLHESNKSFTIEFSPLNYQGEKQGIFSYRLRGFDDEWISLEAGEHAVRYTNLPAGSYQLEVKYLTLQHLPPGTQQSAAQTITLSILVKPHFWKSWWFLTLLVIALAALAVALYKRRVAELKRREAERLMKPIERVLRDSDNPEQLQMRIQSILSNQRRYDESSRKSVEADAEEAKRKTKPFMDRVMAIMEKNYMNSEFGVTEFCQQMGMSRSLLSKRLNEETGQSTTQFIRNYRLDIARQILKRGDQRNIAEIAFSVGFNDPKYFSRCFSKLYGTSPSTMIEG